MNRKTRAFYGDSLIKMQATPNKYYDWVIADPPYGIGINTMNYTKSGDIRVGRKKVAKRRDYRNKAEWDAKRPDPVYFSEMLRISKNQIIWGGNYFTDLLPPSQSFIIWDKRVHEKYNNDFADCELAWCSTGVARVFRYLYSGMLQGGEKDKRFHATQKPTALYSWLFRKYVKRGQTVFDPFLGSGSARIVAEIMGIDFEGWERDPDCFAEAEQWYNEETAGLIDFSQPAPEPEQLLLF